MKRLLAWFFLFLLLGACTTKPIDHTAKEAVGFAEVDVAKVDKILLARVFGTSCVNPGKSWGWLTVPETRNELYDVEGIQIQNQTADYSDSPGFVYLQSDIIRNNLLNKSTSDFLKIGDTPLPKAIEIVQIIPQETETAPTNIDKGVNKVFSLTIETIQHEKEFLKVKGKMQTYYSTNNPREHVDVKDDPSQWVKTMGFFLLS